MSKLENEALESPDEMKIYDYNRDPMRNKHGLSYLGKLPYRKSVDIKKSIVGIGMETLDRDTFDPNDIYGFLADSGVKWARCQTGWLKCEKEKGVYDFAWLENIVESLLHIGIQPWFSVSFGNPLYTPVEEYDNYAVKHPGERPPGRIRGYVGEVPLYHGAEAVKGWHNYLVALANRFKGRVSHWEIWNEPDHLGMFWLHKGQKLYPEIKDDSQRRRRCSKDYAEFVKISSSAIKSVIPAAKIIGIATDIEYLRGLRENNIAEHIDVFAYHYYGFTPEYYAREKFDLVKTIIGKPGKKIDFWMGESGKHTGKPQYPSYFPTEYNQAKFLTRRFVTDLNCGVGLSSYFTASDLSNYYPDGSDQHYGIINRKEKRPKLSFSALQSIAWIFDGIEKAEDLFIGFTPVHDAQFSSSLIYHLATGAFRRKGIPVFSAYLPENVDISATPVTGELLLSIEMNDQLNHPIIIDPIRRNVYEIKHISKPQWAAGSYVINPLTFVDYPMFITDISVLDDKRE